MQRKHLRIKRKPRRIKKIPSAFKEVVGKFIETGHSTAGNDYFTMERAWYLSGIQQILTAFPFYYGFFRTGTQSNNFQQLSTEFIR